MDKQEVTPQEETQAAEVATEQPKEEVVPRSEFANLQRKHAQKDREIQELRSRLTNIDNLLEARDKKVFDALELLIQEDDEDVRPVSRRERLRQIRDAEKPAPQSTRVDPAFQSQLEEVKEKAAELGVDVDTDKFKAIAYDADSDKWLEPKVVLRKLHKLEIEMAAAAKAKELIEAERLETARKLKESGATKPDGAPSAARTPERIQPGEWNQAKATARTPADLLKQFQGRV